MTEQSEKNTIPHRIAIVGAGVSGLVLAHGLQKNGFQVTVYEKENFIGERVWEWSMIVHWALPTLRTTLPENVFANLPRAHANPFYPYTNQLESLPFYNGVTGEYAFSMTAEFRRMSRTRMRKVCAEGLDIIKWGTKVVDLQMDETGPVTLVMEDGTQATADLVIGTDGSSSMIRQWLLGKELGTTKSSEWAIGSGIIKYTAEQTATIMKPSEICACSTGPDGLVLYATIDAKDQNDRAGYSLQIVRIWKGNEPGCEGVEAIRKIKASVSPEFICEPFYSASQWIREDSKPVFVCQLRYWPTTPWDNRGGRVTLVGDAAHCMLPNRGQGLNHALNDIGTFMEQITKVKDGFCSIQEALAAYEAEVFVRGKTAVLESLEDSRAIMTTQNFEGSRQAKKGLAK